MFNGLTSNLGDLVHLSDACSRSISPENFTGEKGKGGMATEGTGAVFSERARSEVEDIPVGRDKERRDLYSRRDKRTRCCYAYLDNTTRNIPRSYSAYVLGRL